MPNISRSVSNYQVPFLHLNAAAEHQLPCRMSDLYRCSVTVGNPSFLSSQDIRRHGFWRVLYTSIIEKASVVFCNIEVNAQLLRRTSMYDTYISDKKRDVSYNLGMAFAKFHSEQLLGIRNLIHLEFLKKRHAIVFVQQVGNRRPQEPDLLGQSADGSWHLFEAKGTSYKNKLAEQISYGKNQTSQVSTIHGQLPATRTVSATYIGKDRIFTHLEDPSDGGVSIIDFDEADYNRAYYAPFLLSQQKDYPEAVEVIINGVNVHRYELPVPGGMLSIGVLSSILPAIINGNPGDLSSALRNIAEISVKGDDQYSFGLDGFVVGFKAD